ncbi:hypothetical protein F0U44_06520 [Nocardioides humilatus]|uniref:Mce-associated membrane protein n=1 Tax=Nocardioides humilatus TaxID=2607660 RepID=A0A5B1LN48_9ACTN|nr:hypothetical protein [Nocardioides humilatus]KAA1421916.1 hypothetical protein F0U44_06520 [Nocardioides humilatus]
MRPLPRLVLPILLGLVIAALVAFFVVDPDPAQLPHKAPQLGDAGGGDYVPGSVPGDSGEAVDVAVEALPLALAYDYRSLRKGLDAATALMTDDFGKEFRRTFESSAADLARTQHAVTTATVRAAGVVRVEKDHVLCLVYVDQLLVSSTTVKDEDAPVRVSQNRVLVGVTEDGDGWRVDSIDPI